MSCWQDETIPFLRVLINDMDGTSYEFSDNRLQDTLLVAARYITQEIAFTTTYVVSFADSTIAPDPSVAPDAVFMNFMVLKAACIIDVGSARLAAMTSGLEAKCGPGVMRTLRRMEGFGTLLNEGSCATYEQLKTEYRFGNIEWIKGILSPFVNAGFIPHLHDHGGTSLHFGGHRTGFHGHHH